MKKIQLLFMRGLFTLLPTVITIYLLFSFFSLLDSIIGDFIEYLVGYPLPGVGVISSLLLILGVGFFVTNVLGSKLIAFGERIIHRIPIVTNIYFGIKQIIDAFSMEGKRVFNKVVLIEYPRKGLYALVFLTGESKGEVQEKTHSTLVNVFIPTTPNPTSGMLLLIPKGDVINLDMTVEEGLKLIVSAGVVVPEYKVKNLP